MKSRLFKKHKKKLAEGYQDIHSQGKRHIYRRPYVLPIFGLLIGVAIVAAIVYSHRNQATFRPSDSHVVFLFDDGKKETLDTKATTVGQLISRLPLNLIPQDVVEPSLRTQIVEDNLRINIYRARPVTVVADSGNKIVTLTAQKSPREVAQTAGLTVYPEDNVSFAEGSVKENIIGEKVVIDRATPVFLNLYGTPLTIRTHVKTVADLVKEKGIKIAKGDTLQPSAGTLLSPNIQVFIERMGTQIVSTTQSVAPPIQYISDPNLTYGTTAVRQAGTAGSEVITYQVETTNGVETGRKVIQTVLTVQPVTEIVALGSAPFSGSLQTWLYKLRSCESGGNYQDDTGNGYYGAYQFGAGTWDRLNTGYARADLAPPAVQDQAIITNTVRSSGGLATQNPGCYSREGLSAFPPSNR